MAFVYIGFFVLFCVVVVNISDYLQKIKQSQKRTPGGITVDSIPDVYQTKQRMIEKFENVIEIGLKDTLNGSVKRIPPHLKDGTSQLLFIKQEVSNYLNCVRNDDLFTDVLSGQEINESIEKAYKKVMNNISSALSKTRGDI